MDFPASSYSWTFVSPATAIKKMDKSSFLHRGTGIPKKDAAFFGLPETGLESPRKITLHVDGIVFEGRFEMDAVHSRYRMFWLSDLAQQIQNRFPDYYERFKAGQAIEGDTPNMIFKRQTDNSYSVTWELPKSEIQTSDARQSDWSDEELHAAVAAYFGMLRKELSGEPCSKTEVNKELRQDILANRSKGSVEFRMANISAVLEGLNNPIVKGFLPRGNVGSKVSERIRSIISDEGLLILKNHAPSARKKTAPEHRSPRYADFGDAPNDDPEELQQFAARVRRGQPKFRDNLLKAFGGKCSISGHGPAEVLEAVHIVPHAETGINELDNGLLLRCDLHALFDAHLLRIDPTDRSVSVDVSLKMTPYWEFNGNTIRERIDGSSIRTTYLKQRWDGIK